MCACGESKNCCGWNVPVVAGLFTTCDPVKSAPVLPSKVPLKVSPGWILKRCGKSGTGAPDGLMMPTVTGPEAVAGRNRSFRLTAKSVIVDGTPCTCNA